MNHEDRERDGDAAVIGGWATGTGLVETEVIDQALRLVAEEHAALGALLDQPTAPPSVAALRRSPLGRDLRFLAAAGREPARADAVRAAARRVAAVLFRSSAAEGATVPAWFRRTTLGALVARAERAAAGATGLVTPAAAAIWLGVPTAAVEGWLAEGVVAGVADEAGGVLVPVEEVARRRAVARALTEESGDILLAERSVAS